MDDDEQQKPKLLWIIGLSFVAAVGVLIEVIASVFFGGWWLIFVVMAFGLIPLPNFCCKRIGGDPLATGKAFSDWGNFLTGVLVVAGLGVPIILAHVQIIRVEGLITAICGGIVVMASICIYLWKFHRIHSDDET